MSWFNIPPQGIPGYSEISNSLSYVKDNAEELKKQHGDKIIVVVGTGVLGSGPNLDHLLDEVDLDKSYPVVIAGTVDSILNGKELPYVWLQNKYASTFKNMQPVSMADATYGAELKAQQLHGAMLGKHPEILDGSIKDAENFATNINQARSIEVYKKGTGYTSKDFK